MATRAIVTSQPIVACDVCGRRLLRGETPDVFLVGGHRRTVCELCVPRAAAEGWLRESEEQELSVRPARPRRAGSLLGRLRQLREPQERPPRRATGPRRRRTAVESEGLYEDGLYGVVGGAEEQRPPGDGQAVFIGSVQAEHPEAAVNPDAQEQDAQEQDARGRDAHEHDATAIPSPAQSERERKLERALSVFNEGETPQRVAGVSRSLGAPTVVVRLVEDAGCRVEIVVAWELCWYRYEVDLDGEVAGAQLVSEGMELDELPEEDRVANAAADERGELALSVA